MAFRLRISDTVTFPVEGTLKDASGADAPFSFRLVGQRLTQDVMRDLSSGALDNVDAVDWLAERVTGWHDVLDDDGKRAEFSTEALRQMLQLIGLPRLAIVSYVTACGAQGRAKN